MPAGHGCAVGKGPFGEEKKAESLHQPAGRIVRRNDDAGEEVRLIYCVSLLSSTIEKKPGLGGVHRNIT